jgi:hypothetical protein
VDVYHGVNLDLDTIVRPAWPAGLEVTTRKEPMPGWLRLTVLGGGIAAYLIVLAVGASLGGIAWPRSRSPAPHRR